MNEIAINNAPERAGSDDAELLREADALLRLRYRQDDDRPKPRHWNAVLSSLLSHRSVRAYLPTPVPSDILESAIAAAQSASTSLNLQAWSVVAIEDRQQKKRVCVGVADQTWIHEAPLYLIWLADLSRHQRIAEATGADRGSPDPNNLDPILTGVADTALAAQNAAVAFESFGLGLVYIGALRLYQRELRAALGLPRHVLPVFGMCVGYPDADRETGIKPRLPLSAVLHRERYDTAPQLDAVWRYDRKLHAYNREQGREAPTWSEYSLYRLDRMHESQDREDYNQAIRDLNLSR
ncbi:nitroreductase family protein [Telmatospirillum siberiense]|uniref:NADPH-dependent oxidoreductase n=1 Tax=Telmatospirillum siberiense TaxID=382514 RepID=A0A2N3Q194_9PROT|nr:nitroreductase family protein [Telmatospirillum siberiense]PKU26425.1 NADPH-dependent oxidoreductase [Telmatospirillum siberiense]